MTIDIRPFDSKDAEEVSNIIISNLLYVNVIDYGEALVKKLSSYYFPKDIIKYSQNEEMFVALSGPKITGTISLDNDRIRNVFVNIDHQRTGIGTGLMFYIEKFAKEKNKERLFLHSNLSSVNFYKKIGYKSLGVIDEKLADMIMKLARMEKRLL